MGEAKVILRDWQESDIEPLTVIRNDVELQAKLMARLKDSTPDIVREWAAAKSSAEGSIFRIIACQPTDAMLGYLQIVGIDSLDRCGEIGICILPEMQGKGVGPAAIRIAFREFSGSLRKLWLRVRGDNFPAIKSYEGLGFRKVGVLEAHSLWDGKYRDVVIMERLLPEPSRR